MAILASMPLSPVVPDRNGMSLASVQKEPVKIKLDLSPFFAKGTTVTAYTDDTALNGSCKPLKLGKKPVDVVIPENGAVLFTKE